MTCTLGEVKNRADLIIYWGGNPAECHPRHFTKYTLTQKGKFVPNGRKDRTMVLVDIRETPSAKAADIFLQVRPAKDFEVITVAARAHQGPAGGPEARRRDRADRRAAAGLRRPDEEVQVRRAVLRHGPVDDARQAHELGGAADAGGRAERLHEVRRHADARPRQRHRRRRGHALDDGLSVRRQPVPAATRASTRASSRPSTC